MQQQRFTPAEFQILKQRLDDRDLLRAENARLRALLVKVAKDLNLDADSGLASPDARLRFSRYVRDIRAALAAKKG